MGRAKMEEAGEAGASVMCTSVSPNDDKLSNQRASLKCQDTVNENQNSESYQEGRGANYDYEGWHLIEPEENSRPVDSVEDKNCIVAKEMATVQEDAATNQRGKGLVVINNNNNNNNGKVFIELDPLGPKENYSDCITTLCAFLYSHLILAALLCLFALIWLLFTKYYFISLLYLTLILYDKNTCNRGGRRVNFFYYSSFWTHLAAYFPMKLRHPEDFKLDPSENYILNYHPHGIHVYGSVCAFATNGLNFEKLFPGIKARFLVHETTFVTPLFREVYGLRGDCSVNSKSIDYILSQKNGNQNDERLTGNLLALVAGGLAEADLCDPETIKTVILNRKGFVKKALIHGANLIPCIAFGENSIFTSVHFSDSHWWKKFETWWYDLFQFKQPIHHGRSIISEKFKCLLPYKNPITIVMGNPIKVELNESPSQEEIDQLHANYLSKLKSLYEANSDLCKIYDKKLELI